MSDFFFFFFVIYDKLISNDIRCIQEAEKKKKKALATDFWGKRNGTKGL